MKKIIALLLALTMVFALAACGSKPAEAPAAAAPAAAPAAEEKAEAPAAAAEEEPDYSDYTIRIYSNSNSTERDLAG